MAASRIEAELPTLTPAQLRGAIDDAQRAAVRLRVRPVDAVLASIDRVITNWLAPDSVWRRRAEQTLPQATGFSPRMIQHGLPLLLEPLRAQAIGALLDDELGGDRHILDAPVRGARACGPPLITHVLSGNIPGLAAAPIVLSLAIKSAALVKTAAGDPVFAPLFAASMREVDEELAQCLVVTHWRGGNPAIEDVAFAAADVVVASGADASIAVIGKRVCGRFIGHGHKVSFAVIGAECLVDLTAAHDLARRLAYDVSLWDQQGCLSPQLCYVEAGGSVPPEQFADLLAEALASSARELPPRTLSLDEKTEILRFRQTTEWHGAQTLRASSHSTDWTVSVEPDAEFLPSCLNRCIRLKVVSDVAALGAAFAAHRHHLEAVGLAVGAARVVQLSEVLAASGVHRICPIGTMQTPTLAWRQSGRPRVADWVVWTRAQDAGRE